MYMLKVKHYIIYNICTEALKQPRYIYAEQWITKLYNFQQLKKIILNVLFCHVSKYYLQTHLDTY